MYVFKNTDKLLIGFYFVIWFVLLSLIWWFAEYSELDRECVVCDRVDYSQSWIRANDVRPLFHRRKNSYQLWSKMIFSKSGIEKRQWQFIRAVFFNSLPIAPKTVTNVVVFCMTSCFFSNFTEYMKCTVSHTVYYIDNEYYLVDLSFDEYIMPLIIVECISTSHSTSVVRSRIIHLWADV